MKNVLISTLCLASLLLVLIGCEPEDAYKEYVKNGLKTFPGTPINLRAQPGNNRARLSWAIIDAKVEKFVIQWNNGQDSLVVPVVSTGAAAETLNVLIDQLPESDYLFKVVALDNKGNRSIAKEAQANVYGETYIKSLLNRPLTSAKSLSGTATLVWGNTEEMETGLELTYTDKAGVVKKVLVPRSETTTILPNYKNGTQFSYRTFYLPDSSAIDTVAALPFTPAAPEITYPLLDKTKFALRRFPTDQRDAFGWVMPLMWDNNVAEGKGFHTAEIAFPYHFSFDLGVTTELHEMKLWQRHIQLFTGASTRYFEVWGSNDPAADGSYTGWTKLLVCESVKPSGQVSGYTPADEAYAKAGESFIFPDDSSPVRYIRFKVLGNWAAKNPGGTHIMEVSFWSK